MIYLIVLILMLCAAYAFDLRGHKAFSSVAYWSFFVLLVMIAGLRYRIGTDSVGYENSYESFPRLWELAKYKFSSTRFEPGYIVFSSIPRSLSSDFVLFQFFHATIVNGVFFWFIKNNCRHKFLCLSFYFLCMYLNLNTQVLRESLAVCIFLLAWPSFRDGKWIVYYLLIFLATFFHTSAFFLLVLPLFCLPGIKEIFKVGRRTFLILPVIFLIGFFIQRYFEQIFLAMAVNDRMSGLAMEYAGNRQYMGVLSAFGMLSSFVKDAGYPLLAAFFVYAGVMKKKTKNGPQEVEKSIVRSNVANERYEIIVMTSVYFVTLSLSVFILLRYVNYFGIFSLALIADWAFTRLRIKRKTYRLKFAYWLVILLPFFFIQLQGYTTGVNKSGTLRTYMAYYPYYTVLDPQTDHNREKLFHYFSVR